MRPADATLQARILESLISGGKITALDALDLFGTMRLAAHIHALRRRGHEIISVRESLGRRWWVRYSLQKLAPKAAAE